MAGLKDTIRKHRRLCILRALKDAALYTSNASILQDMCVGFGVPTSRAQMVTELAWLKDIGFVTYDDREDFLVVTATHDGVEIALGRMVHPEIQRPRAGS